MNGEPLSEHQWLQKLVGEWTYESEALMKPGEPPAKHSGTESVRSIGGLWVVAEGKGEMPGCGPATTLLTIGFDPQKKRYVGTWIGSMMTQLWIYDGTLEGNVLTLESEGPDITGGEGKTAKYRDVIELKSDDQRTLTSFMQGPDGAWQQFVIASYRRV